MGTHPIFESDFDCLTELIGSAFQTLTSSSWTISPILEQLCPSSSFLSSLQFLNCLFFPFTAASMTSDSANTVPERVKNVVVSIRIFSNFFVFLIHFFLGLFPM